MQPAPQTPIVESLAVRESGPSMGARLPRRARTSTSLRGVELPDDRFVPVRSEDLVAALQADASLGVVASRVSEVASAMEALVEQEAATLRRALSRRYERFNPARETVVVTEDDAKQCSRSLGELCEVLEYLLDKANYERLDDGQLASALSVTNSHGIRVRVDPGRVRILDLYVRGQTTVERRIRTLRHPLAGEERKVELFRRLAVVFQLADEEVLNLKLFRDIPVADVEALLPHAEVEMSTFDRLKIVGGGLGALGGLLVKAITSLIKGAMMTGQLLWAVIAALLGLSFRSFFGYRRAKHARVSQMTHNLYYQNVANNVGVLDLLLANIAEEELKEAVLAYALLRARPEVGWPDLGSLAHEWLSRTFGVDVDFDVDDALETLRRFGLVASEEDCRPVDPDTALTVLRQRWVARDGADYHLRAWAQRRAADPAPD